MKFRAGDIIEYQGGWSGAVQKGAFATVVKYPVEAPPEYGGVHGKYMVKVIWHRDNGLDEGQMNGHYFAKYFTVVKPLRDEYEEICEGADIYRSLIDG